MTEKQIIRLNKINSLVNSVKDGRGKTFHELKEICGFESDDLKSVLSVLKDNFTIIQAGSYYIKYNRCV